MPRSCVAVSVYIYIEKGKIIQVAISEDRTYIEHYNLILAEHIIRLREKSRFFLLGALSGLLGLR